MPTICMQILRDAVEEGEEEGWGSGRSREGRGGDQEGASEWPRRTRSNDAADAGDGEAAGAATAAGMEDELGSGGRRLRVMRSSGSAD